MTKTKKLFLTLILLAVALATFIPIAVFAEPTKEVEWINVVWAQEEYQETELPNGLLDHSYPVPKCVLYDNNGNAISGLDTVVYAPDGSLVAVKDGRFNTDMVGIYIICYKGAYKELSTEKQIKVNVLESCESLSYVINQGINKTPYTGQDVVLYDGTVVGGLGAKNVTVSVTKDGQDCIVYDFGGVKYFTPKNSGNYVIKYELSDFVNATASATETVVVTDCEKPLMDEIPLSRKMRVGETVKFPVVDAELYVGENSYLVPVKVFVDQIEVTDTMSYLFKEVGIYTVKYVAENVFNSEYKTEREYFIEVVNHCDWDQYDGTYHYIENYIFNQSCERTFVNGTLTLVADDDAENCSVAFAKKINNKFLSLEFGVVYGKSALNQLKLKLVDSNNSDETLDLCFAKDKKGKKTEIFLNGEYVNTINYYFDSENVELSTIYVRVDCVNNAILDANGVEICKIKTYANGKSFKGFSSNSAYFSLSAEGITGEAAITLNSIANGYITDLDVDGSIPQTILNDKFNTIILAEINEDIVMPYIEFFDLCDDIVEVTLFITDPDNQAVLLEVITSDKVFKAAKYGTYSATYTAKDASGNSNIMYCNIHVVDRIAPTIKVEPIKSVVEVGETLTLPKPQVSDNYTEKCSCYIYIVSDQYQSDYINNYSYTFKDKGDYLIRYVVHDEYMNTVVVEFKISCR